MPRYRLIPRKPKLLLFNIAVLAIALQSFSLFGGTVPFGSWRYTIYQDTREVGNAVIRRSMKMRKIHTSSEISFFLADTFTVSRETIVEEGNFTPVSYSSESTFVTMDTVKRVTMSARVEDDRLHVSDGSRTLTFNITKDLNFGSNILIASLLKTGLKVESSGIINMYDPSVSPTKTIRTHMTCGDVEKVQVGKHTALLHRIVVRHKNKVLYTMFCDKSGIVHKYVMSLGGRKLELILIAYDS
ncbi:MAG: hypothetical protein ACOC2H_00725 [Spirochaetota bacterium]